MARLKDGSTVGGSEILTEGNLESLLGYLPLDPQDLTWSKLSGKPSTFTPSAHTHPWSEVTGKPTTFAPSAHTHSISDVAGLRVELDSIPELTKANVGLGNVDNVKQASKTEHDQLASDFSTHQSDDATTSKKGHVQLSDATNSTSNALAATPSAVKLAMDRANEAFQSASDGKDKIATAVSGKGVPTSSSDTFTKMASNIDSIDEGFAPPSVFKRTKTIHYVSENGDVYTYNSEYDRIEIYDKNMTLLETITSVYRLSSMGEDHYVGIGNDEWFIYGYDKTLQHSISYTTANRGGGLYHPPSGNLMFGDSYYGRCWLVDLSGSVIHESSTHGGGYDTFTNYNGVRFIMTKSTWGYAGKIVYVRPNYPWILGISVSIEELMVKDFIHAIP